MSEFKASEWVRKIYLKGNAGIRSVLPFTFEELEQKAKLKMSKKGFDYVKTGAGSHLGLLHNKKAFEQYALLPKMAHGIQSVDLGTKLLGLELPIPVLFAPIGVLGLAHPNADEELAKASNALKVPMIFSNQASVCMEDVSAKLNGVDHWFQLYFSKSYELVESFIQRAEQCGSKAIVLTLDTTTLGFRVLDLNNGYLPFAQGQGIAQYISDPVFKKLLTQGSQLSKINVEKTLSLLLNVIQMTKSYPGNFWNNWKTKEPLRAVSKFIEIFSKPNLSWEDVDWLRQKTKLPIVLKGILRSDDAQKAVDLGIDGIIVSNHGGRQVDHVVASLDALTQIKKVVPPNFPLILDSGIRSATHIYISLALGAKSVLIGRPYVYAMAIDGANGVEEYIHRLATELEITMLLCGNPTIESISSNFITKLKE